MSETLTLERAAASFPAFHPPAGSGLLCAAYGSYTVPANVTDGDIWKLCKLPKGAVVLGGAFYTADLDTGTGVLDLDVGWAANGVEAASAAGFVNCGALTGAAVTDILAAGSNYRPFPMATGPLTFSAETTVQVEANVAANAFTAGTIFVVVYYVVV